MINTMHASAAWLKARNSLLLLPEYSQKLLIVG
jgi:hypothetical protein